jgi:bride of sevenless protein
VVTEHVLQVGYKNKTNLLPTDIIIILSIFTKILEVLNNNNNCVTNETCPQIFKNNSNLDLNFATTMIPKYFENFKLGHLVEGLNYDLVQKTLHQTSDNGSMVELNLISSVNLAMNTTVSSLKDKRDTLQLADVYLCHESILHTILPHPIDDEQISLNAGYWTIKSEMWVAVALTIACLGILFCILIFGFIMVRVYMKDVLEGNPNNSVALLITLMLQFMSIIPFAMEYRSDSPADFNFTIELRDANNTLCSLKIFSISIFYSITFSLLLCRALMLASISSEGGFLSHVNG